MTKCSLAREGESDASAGSTEGPNQEMYTYCKFSPKSKNKQNFFI